MSEPLSASQPDAPPPGMRDVSIPLDQIAGNPRVVVLSLALTFIPLLPHLLIWGFSGDFDSESYLLGVVAFFVLIVAHELVHALGWIVFGPVSPSQIKFGFALRTLTPYAHAQVPMRARGYRIGAALPLFVTGLLPVIAGTLTGAAWLTVAGAMLVSGAVGDLLVLWVIREVPDDARVVDHPRNAGCYVVEG
jgi:hypothetical protein